MCSHSFQEFSVAKDGKAAEMSATDYSQDNTKPMIFQPD